MNAMESTPPPARRDRGRRWPLFVVGLLVAHVALMMTAVVVITRGPGDPIVPGYYQKGVEWDRTHAAPRTAATGRGVRP
jgi:hypothetical protein